MNVSWYPDTASGTTRENPLLKQEEHRLFDFPQFSISVHNLLIVLYSMLVISHWLMFVVIHVILSK